MIQVMVYEFTVFTDSVLRPGLCLKRQKVVYTTPGLERTKSDSRKGSPGPFQTRSHGLGFRVSVLFCMLKLHTSESYLRTGIGNGLTVSLITSEHEKDSNKQWSS